MTHRAKSPTREVAVIFSKRAYERQRGIYEILKACLTTSGVLVDEFKSDRPGKEAHVLVFTRPRTESDGDERKTEMHLVD